MLSAFLRSQADLPFAWGRTDCTSTAEGWVRLATGRAPIAAMGWSFASETEALAILPRRGGLLAAMCLAMGRSGFSRTRQASVGDVGLVVPARTERACAAILNEAGWVSRDADGFILVPRDGRVLRAWRIACPSR